MARNLGIVGNVLSLPGHCELTVNLGERDFSLCLRLSVVSVVLVCFGFFLAFWDNKNFCSPAAGHGLKRRVSVKSKERPN